MVAASSKKARWLTWSRTAHPSAGVRSSPRRLVEGLEQALEIGVLGLEVVEQTREGGRIWRHRPLRLREAQWAAAPGLSRIRQVIASAITGRSGTLGLCPRHVPHPGSTRSKCTRGGRCCGPMPV